MAARLLTAVLDDGQSLTRAAPLHLALLGDERDRAFAQACVYGVLRNYYTLAERLDAALARPLRARDADVRALLLCGLFQLQYMRTPAHAAVAASVEAARGLGKRWAASLVNAVLRGAARAAAAPAAAVSTTHFEHPAWLVERIARDWPEDWRAILAANNAQAPLTLRVNLARVTRERYLEQLAAAGLAARPGAFSPAAVTLAQAVAVERLPGFTTGEVSVQDEAAQLVALLVDAPAGARVLDACAAPGGKTAHLLERAAGALEVVALDHEPQRLADLRATLVRLDLAAELACADATEPDTWWGGRTFDRVLLDAPCSALGVVRRHPDIRFHRRDADIAELVAAQQRLLRALWPLVAPGGKLVYATCSVLPAENDAVVASLLESVTDAECASLPAAYGRPTAHGSQILPGEHDMDGFYYACLTRTTAPA
ncbi:MAG: 16S rRNA (cytosine(967)-C(5))-methyltransferase RsmB [Gammaproteobacteria bacterium]